MSFGEWELAAAEICLHLYVGALGLPLRKTGHSRNRLHGLSMDDVPLKEMVGGTR